MTETEAAAPTGLPDRYRDALVHVIDDLMPEAWCLEMGSWIHHRRSALQFRGDVEGQQRYSYEIVDIDAHCELVAAWREKLLETSEAGMQACDVDPDFALEAVESHLTMHHNGGHFDWHHDGLDHREQFAKTRRITFAYYMRTEPVMFSGGELEFLDGTKIEPTNNRLVWFHPLQKHRIVPVECWSKEAIHARWAIVGWLHGEPPEGYALPRIYDRYVEDYQA